MQFGPDVENYNGRIFVLEELYLDLFEMHVGNKDKV